MEIHNTLLQGLSQALLGGGQQLPQAPLPQPAELAAGQLGCPSERTAASEQIPGLAQANQTGDSSSILTSGEKEILDLFFNGQGGMDLSLYGRLPSKPAVLGNFLDMRG